MDNFDFEDIAPFEGEAFEQAMERLIQYPQLLENFTDIISRHNRLVNSYKAISAKKTLRDRLKEVRSYDDFQKRITSEVFLNMIESSSIDELSFGGISDFDGDKPHIYISNHRDIVLDTALLDYVLYKSDKMLCEMVIGDNLLVNQFVTDLFKVNGAITIKRNASSATELKETTTELSAYITHCVEDKKKSVWIAQKSGRSKDGLDNTNAAVVKMLYLASREQGLSFSQFLDRVSIVPVAISYQYDPCAVTKGQSEVRRLKAEGCYNVYKKKKYADVLDMVRGLRLNKGNVHIEVGKELTSDIQDPRSAVRELDRQIHLNYRLWDTNWFCYDYLNGNRLNEDKYNNLNTKAFIKKYSCVNSDVFNYILNSYANPVRSYLNEKND